MTSTICIVPLRAELIYKPVRPVKDELQSTAG